VGAFDLEHPGNLDDILDVTVVFIKNYTLSELLIDQYPSIRQVALD